MNKKTKNRILGWVFLAIPIVPCLLWVIIQHGIIPLIQVGIVCGIVGAVCFFISMGVAYLSGEMD